MTQTSEQPVTLRNASLWALVLERYRQASSAGALLPIDTEQVIVQDGAVRFVVRRLFSLARKHDEAARSGAARNPFLPYDPDLFVAQVGPDHVALLNKYPVIAHHLLIVTRRFEDQETLLTSGDFAALAACLAQIDGLAFYNGGAAAGASQPHKHLQLVPLPLGGDHARVPIEPVLSAAPAAACPDRVPGLPFRHGFVRLPPAMFDDPQLAAGTLAQHYRSLCAACGIEGRVQEGTARQSAPYNLLLTRAWMLLVPRTRECADGISINALGFAGCLLVRDEAQMRLVLERGPMALLQAVSVSLP